MSIAQVNEPFDAGSILSALADRQLLGVGMGPGRIRLVTHLDIGEHEIRQAVETIAALPVGPGMS